MDKGRKLARTLYNKVWEVCCQRKGRFGFFASLLISMILMGRSKKQGTFLRPTRRLTVSSS
ncbi:hypothetical protein BKA67DRAFT_574819 [Truncatella angustata]|uniref:Uncharacterized protein n=1 Tax=Truncatella angustata TaxID=152316 RepID=A0A9P8ZUS4_9PEZI|nr:uncharacterized protein BKA67DRAFT_574819 [Truncatella angustata]KAH6648443.1 hypothetical protein BKA67DRAFT_574819 [Truncatella angustata]